MQTGSKLTKRVSGAAIMLLLIVAALELTSFVFLYINFGDANIKDRLQRTLVNEARLHDVPANERSLDYMRQHVLHPYIGYVRNSRITSHRVNDAQVDEPVNEFGFFGPDPLTRKSEDAFIVAITGGSVALEFYLYGRQLLESELRKGGIPANKKIVFVALALGGMKQPQQLAVLGYLLALGAEYDVVLNIDGFNEVALPYAENREYGVNPFYPRSWHLYSTKSIDAQTAMLTGEMSTIKQDLVKWGRRLWYFPLRESYTVLALWQQYRGHLLVKGQEIEGRLRDHLKQERELTAQETGPNYGYSTGGDFMPELTAVWSNASRQMWALCKANDIAYFHFLQPNQYFPQTHEITPWERDNAFIEKNNLYAEGARKGYKYLKRGGSVLNESGLPFVDLSMIFHDEKQAVYRDSCCHYNQLGQNLLATQIGAAMTSLLGERRVSINGFH